MALEGEKHWTESLDLVIESCRAEFQTAPAEQGSMQAQQNDFTKDNNNFIVHSPRPTMHQVEYGLQFSGTLDKREPPPPPPHRRASSAVVFPSSSSFQSHLVNNNSPTFEFPSFISTSSSDSQQEVHKLERPASVSRDNSQQFFTDSAFFENSLESAGNNTSSAPSSMDGVDSDKIGRYLYVLSHASGCFDKRCPLKECHKMRAFIGHVNNCSQAGTGCRLCRRFFLLSRLHSSTCDKGIGHCPVLFCSHFKLENPM